MRNLLLGIVAATIGAVDETSSPIDVEQATDAWNDSTLIGTVNGRPLTAKNLRTACALRFRGPEVVDDVANAWLIAESISAPGVVDPTDVASGNWHAIADKSAGAHEVDEASIQRLYYGYPSLWNGETERVFEERTECRGVLHATYIVAKGADELSLAPAVRKLKLGEESNQAQEDGCTKVVRFLSSRTAPQLTIDEARPIIVQALRELSRNTYRHLTLERASRGAAVSILSRPGCAALQGTVGNVEQRRVDR